MFRIKANKDGRNRARAVADSGGATIPSPFIPPPPFRLRPCLPAPPPLPPALALFPPSHSVPFCFFLVSFSHPFRHVSLASLPSFLLRPSSTPVCAFPCARLPLALRAHLPLSSSAPSVLLCLLPYWRDFEFLRVSHQFASPISCPEANGDVQCF